MQFSIRDLLWLMTVVALAVLWQRDRAAWSMQRRDWSAERQSLVKLRTMRGVRVLPGGPATASAAVTPERRK